MQRLTITRAASIIIFLLLFMLATRIPVDTDTWWHIRSGEYTLTNGMIYADPFSHTMQGQPWINHSWGAQIVLFGAWHGLGNAGLALYTSILATVGMYFIYRMCAGNVYLRGFALILGAATAAVFWSPRPQMFSFALSAALLYILYLYRHRQADRLWLIPLLLLVWGNLHAGFSIGYILLGGVIAGESLGNLLAPQAEKAMGWPRLRKLVLVSGVAVGALVINPYGLQLYSVPFATVNIGALQNFIQEWNSPNFHERQTWPFIALLIGLLGAVGASRLRLSWTSFVLASGTLFMALTAGRNIAVFAVVATPIFSAHLDAVLHEKGWILHPVQRVTAGMARLNLALIAVIALVVLVSVLSVMDVEAVEMAQSEYLPLAAVAYLNRAQPPGPIFNSYNWGGYLIFTAPDYPVYVDGRTDLYGDAFLTRWYATAIGAAGWRDALSGINLVLVEAGSGLALNLSEEPDWSQAYADDLAVLFTRDVVD